MIIIMFIQKLLLIQIIKYLLPYPTIKVADCLSNSEPFICRRSHFYELQRSFGAQPMS